MYYFTYLSQLQTGQTQRSPKPSAIQHPKPLHSQRDAAQKHAILKPQLPNDSRSKSLQSDEEEQHFWMI